MSIPRSQRGRPCDDFLPKMRYMSEVMSHTLENAMRRPLPRLRAASRRCLAALLLAGLFLLPGQARADSTDGSLPPDALTSPWLSLRQGLDFHIFALDEQHIRQLIVLRIDPAYFRFELFSVSQHGGRPRSLRQWGLGHSLTAVINASMYLPDLRTSTGYLRQGNHSNNGRIVRNYGSIFMAEPMRSSLPRANICDKEVSPCRERVEDYVSVVQNFRILNDRREIVWSAFRKPVAISAIGKDGSGRILFLHCREAMPVREFARHLRDLPLDIRATMYVEGGAQAGLFVQTPRLTHLWGGRHASDFLAGIAGHAPLPNVLGIMPRAAQ